MSDDVQVTDPPAPPPPDDPFASDPHPEKKSGRSVALEWIVLIVGALLIAFLIKTFLFQAFYIPSASMVPTLEIHDRVLVNKLSYDLHSVNRGDIVVFTAPPGQESANIKDLVKRVIGLPGETIETRDGRVYIDGRLLNEPYLPRGTRTDSIPQKKVPDGSLWVMGDNRTASKDSRVFGTIPKSSVIGRVFFRIWPPSRIGFL